MELQSDQEKVMWTFAQGDGRGRDARPDDLDGLVEILGRPNDERTLSPDMQPYLALLIATGRARTQIEETGASWPEPACAAEHDAADTFLATFEAYLTDPRDRMTRRRATTALRHAIHSFSSTDRDRHTHAVRYRRSTKRTRARRRNRRPRCRRASRDAGGCSGEPGESQPPRRWRRGDDRCERWSS